MKKQVTLNSENLKTYFKSMILQLAAMQMNAKIPHSNHDDYYSPARWWSDFDQTDRKTLATSATASIRDNKLCIKLIYEVRDME